MFNKLRDGLRYAKLDGQAKEFVDWICSDHYGDGVPKFVFNELSDCEGTVAFGLDLWREGLLSLPFENCYLQIKWPQNDENKHIANPVVAYFATMIGGDTVFVPVADGMVYPPTSLGKNYTIATAQSSHWQKFPQEQIHHDAEMFAGGFLSMIAFLNTKGTKLERVAPREGLNAKRKRQGKRPIHAYTVVKIDPEIIKTYAAKGGTHASPRPHLRRGHLATIYRGTDKERKIIKPPCFVNASGEMQAPAQYRVERA